MTYSTEQKYQFLLNLLKITEVDTWERDGLIGISPIYFQFNREAIFGDKDKIVLQLMQNMEIK